MLTLLAQVLKILNDDNNPYQIALAIWFGLLVAFLDMMNPLMWFVLLIVCLVRVNLSAFLLAWGGFELLAMAMVPVLDDLGYSLLTHPSLVDFWKSLHQIAGVPMMQLGYTVITGGIVFAIVALLPFIFLIPWLIKRYRTQLMPWVEKTRLVAVLKSSKIYQIYQNL
ncbi:MAG: TIGR03546 family protein [Pseudomonadota bacterium]